VSPVELEKGEGDSMTTNAQSTPVTNEDEESIDPAQARLQALDGEYQARLQALDGEYQARLQALDGDYRASLKALAKE